MMSHVMRRPSLFHRVLLPLPLRVQSELRTALAAIPQGKLPHFFTPYFGPPFAVAYNTILLYVYRYPFSEPSHSPWANIFLRALACVFLIQNILQHVIAVLLEAPDRSQSEEETNEVKPLEQAIAYWLWGGGGGAQRQKLCVSNTSRQFRARLNRFHFFREENFF